MLQGTKLAPACSAAGLQSFPTWIINGEKVEGEQTFDRLEGLLKDAT
jgi:Thioredoxin